MEIGALRDEDYSVWMPFEDAEVLVRYVGAEELRGIAAGATSHSWKNHQRVERMDAAEAARLMGRAAVRGWRGITMGGEEYPYSVEHCDFLMERWQEFARFVAEAATDLGELVNKETEEGKKNSSPTSAPEGTSRA